MTLRGDNRRPPNTLTIHPPSPGGHRLHAPRITTPISQIIPHIISPRKAPLPPSPTHSSHSGVSGLSAHDVRARKGSFDVPNGAPPVPKKEDKRLPGLPFHGLHLPRSPRKRGGGEELHGQGAGMYDNKLVSSTLSQLPSLAPLSPTPTGTSGGTSHTTSLTPLAPSMAHKASYVSLAGGALPRPALSAMSSSVGVVLPDGTSLSTLTPEGEMSRTDGRSTRETVAHSSPSSPWSLVTIHVLPIFAGSPLKSSMEDLNNLCHSHIIATSQRTGASRLVAVLTSDLRDFVSSGMLTLKSKLETADDINLIPRIAEIWKFFWTHILSYLEGVFLPFSQMRDLPSSSSAEPARSIPVRHIILSGFLLNILLPLLSRLSILISNPDVLPNDSQPDIPDLRQVLQMSLVLGTQAKYSSFHPFPSQSENARMDEEVREDVKILAKAARWRIGIITQPPSSNNASPSMGSGPDGAPRRVSLQRVVSTGRHRRPGYRGSNSFGQPPPQSEGVQPSRQNSDFFQPESRWGRPRVDEDDEDDQTPGQSLAPSRQDSYVYASTAGTSTLTAGTWREGQGGYVAENQRTPQADLGRRGLYRTGSEESEATPIVLERRGQRV